MLRGVLIGSAAALLVGGGLVAAAVAWHGRRAAPPPAAAAGPQVRILLTAPKEPPAVRGGPKLETLPPGTPDAPLPAPVQAAPAPVRRSEADETYRDGPRRREPEAQQGDFIDEGEPSFLEQRPIDRYSDRRDRWREDRRADRYPPPEPYYPEPPPWWRR